MIKTPLLTVDIIIEYQQKVVLIRRKNDPYKGHYALPGGFVDIGETVEDAARREAKEETGLDIEIKRMVGTYSDPTRDPRGHSVSICYLAEGAGTLQAGDDAASAELFEFAMIPKLAFDHNKMVIDMISETFIDMISGAYLNDEGLTAEISARKEDMRVLDDVWNIVEGWESDGGNTIYEADRVFYIMYEYMGMIPEVD